MKTARELFNEHIKDARILQYAIDYTTEEELGYFYRSFHWAITSSFNWNDTQQGFEFWALIAEHPEFSYEQAKRII